MEFDNADEQHSGVLESETIQLGGNLLPPPSTPAPHDTAFRNVADGNFRNFSLPVAEIAPESFCCSL